MTMSNLAHFKCMGCNTLITFLTGLDIKSYVEKYHSYSKINGLIHLKRSTINYMYIIYHSSILDGNIMFILYKNGKTSSQEDVI